MSNIAKRMISFVAVVAFTFSVFSPVSFEEKKDDVSFADPYWGYFPVIRAYEGGDPRP